MVMFKSVLFTTAYFTTILILLYSLINVLSTRILQFGCLVCILLMVNIVVYLLPHVPTDVVLNNNYLSLITTQFIDLQGFSYRYRWTY